MSKKVYLFSLIVLALMFVSCEETTEVGRYDNWQQRNESYIDSLANVYDTKADHGGLARFNLFQAPNDHIYYKVKEAVTTDELTSDPAILDKYPSSAATVKIYYKGTNILNEYFDGTFTGDRPVCGTYDPEFGATVGDSPTRSYALSGLIVGWQEALQRMKVGERWEIYIPWKYGYGSSGSGSTLGYSTLIFDIQLLDATSVREK